MKPHMLLFVCLSLSLHVYGQVMPKRQWSTYFGGTDQSGILLARGDFGSVYMAGYTTSAVDIATTGAFQTTYSGNDDAFLAKFDSSGSILWATYFGGAGADQALGIASDSSGNVYLSGLTSSTGIATPGAYQTSYGGGIGDAFLAKFSSSGAQLWATYFGGSGTDVSTGVCVDRAGNVCISGYTYSTDSIATPGAYKTIGGGAYTDGFLAKFNSNGNITWSTYFGGNDDDEPVGMACDDSGYVYIAGTTASTDNIATPGAYQHTFQTLVDDDGFLIKFNSNGALKWGTYYGANGSNKVEAITCDGAGNVYLTGSTSCTDSISTPGAYQSALAGPADAFLVKFNNAGTIQWGTYYGNGGEGGNGVAIADSGSVCFTGSTTSATGISTPGAYQASYAGNGDAFLAKFGGNGHFDWGTYFGGPDYDEGFGVICGHANVFISGITKSHTGITTPGANDTAYTATTFGFDAFLAKFGAIPYPGSVAQYCSPKESLAIYPNPARDLITVSWHGIRSTTILLDIMGMTGRRLYSKTMSAATGTVSIDLSLLSPGNYICVFQDGEERHYNKFSVVR